jgi:hypothetical protein
VRSVPRPSPRFTRPDTDGKPALGVASSLRSEHERVRALLPGVVRVHLRAADLRAIDAGAGAPVLIVVYGAVVTRRLPAMGIRDKPIAPASPWQNGFAERLIGSIRRECLDHAIICGETHLRRVRKSYADYYNRFRTHRKDAPVSRSVQRTGVIRSRAILGGLHHHYGRI